MLQAAIVPRGTFQGQAPSLRLANSSSLLPAWRTIRASLPVRPGCALEIELAESVIEQLNLVESRGMHRGRHQWWPRKYSARWPPPYDWGRCTGSGKRPASRCARRNCSSAPMKCSTYLRTRQCACIWPVCDSRNSSTLTVPCLMYSNACCSMAPGMARRIGSRCRAWMLGISSAQTTKKP
jgi:hypothetical protein